MVVRLPMERPHTLRGLLRRHFGTFAAALLMCLLPTTAQARVASLSDLFVFGDSLSDSGNSGELSGGTFTPPPFYSNNRATNGKVAVEYLWDNFNPGNINFRPSLRGGTNYAIIGATTGSENNLEVANQPGSPLNVLYANRGHAWQLEQFALAGPSFQPQTSLFVIWLFPNDVFYFRNTSTNPNSPAATGTSVGTSAGEEGKPGATYPSMAPLAVDNVIGSIDQLASAGASNFLVVNSPDLGQVPAFRGTGLASFMSALSQDFNSRLEAKLNIFASSHPQLDIQLFPLDRTLASVIANPTTYGFSNVTQACLTSGSICTNPDSYLFWDSLHPTTSAHAFIAQRMTSQVPAPLPVLGGLAALQWSRRLRSRTRQGRMTPTSSPPRGTTPWGMHAAPGRALAD